MSAEQQDAKPEESKSSEEKKYDVLAIGNAIVDILVKTNDAFLDSLGLKKGTMSLIDDDKANKLFGLFSEQETSPSASINVMSGGGAANVVAGISSFGGKGAYIGKVSNDASGERFRAKLKERDIEYMTKSIDGGKETGRCLIIVTEDGARTMCTHLGSSQELGAEDINEDLISQSKIVLLTGFLWDCDKGKEAANKIIELADKNECMVAFSLADHLCVERHRDDFMKLVDDNVDILFANKQEINALFNREDHQASIDKMHEKYKKTGKLAILTCSADGVIIVGEEKPITVAAEEVKEIKDTTGAGSLFVSGFLYARTHGFDIEKSAKLGNLSAAECLRHLGARPVMKLKDLIAKL